MVWEIQSKKQKLFFWNNRISAGQKYWILSGLEEDSGDDQSIEFVADKICHNFGIDDFGRFNS
jgi:hypothetical protein